MIYQFQHTADRASELFWEEINQETILRYKDTLQKWHNAMTDAVYDIPDVMRPSDHAVRQLVDALANEIKYCEFYLELAERKLTDGNLNCWVSTKKKDRKDIIHRWNEDSFGDIKVFANGKVRAQVEVIRPEGKAGTKIVASMINDTSILNFTGHGHWKGIHKKTLFKQETIDKHVEEVMEMCTDMLEGYEYPHYCPEERNFELLGKMLHTED